MSRFLSTTPEHTIDGAGGRKEHLLRPEKKMLSSEAAPLGGCTLCIAIKRSASFCICCCPLPDVLRHSQTYEDIIDKSVRHTEKPAHTMDYWKMMPTGTDTV